MTVKSVEKSKRIDLHRGETSFAGGEKIRHEIGYGTLKKILTTDNAALKSLLGIERLPENAILTADWLTPTRITDVQGDACFPNGTKCEFIGTRLAVDVIDRDGKGRNNGKISPTGGGLRIELVEMSYNDGDKTIFCDKKHVKKDIFDEGLGLAIAMGAKNIGLGFKEQLKDVLKKMGFDGKKLKRLLKDAERYSLAGGAKADIYIAIQGKESDYTSEQIEWLKASALKQVGYQLAEKGAIGPLIDRIAGDRGSGGKLMGRPVLMWLFDGYIKYQEEIAKKTGQAVDYNFHLGVLTGKDVGGLEARGDATGTGIYFARKAYCEANDIPLSGESMFIRGVGAAEKMAAILAIRDDVKLQGIAVTSARGGAVLRSEQGFEENDIIELNEVYNNGGDMVAWARKKHKLGRDIKIEGKSHKSGREQAKEIGEATNIYFEKYAPLHIDDSAAQMTINEKNSKFIPTGAVVVQGGNGAVTPLASKDFKKRGVHNVTGILANAGGVFASWFEQAQNLFEIQFPSDLVNKAIENLMNKNIGISMEIIRLARESGLKLSLEEAFYTYAIAQGYRQKMEIEQIN